MTEPLFMDDQLNPSAFDHDVRRWTHDLADVLLAAANTGSPAVESTHFLMAIGQITDGLTQASLARRGLNKERWTRGLGSAARRDVTALPPALLTRASLDVSALAMLQAAQACCARNGLERISEAVLLLSGLEQPTEPVRQLIELSEIDRSAWCQEIERSLTREITTVPVFRDGPDTDGPGRRQVLELEAFSPSGKQVLRLMQREAEALGYLMMDPRHLLLALCVFGGATHAGLHAQGVLPRRVQEAVTLSLRARARQARATLVLDDAHLLALLQQMLRLAGELAGRDQQQRVAEPHILRAFLATESAARAILEEERVDVRRFATAAESFPIEEEDDEELRAADVSVVRERLLRRIVGQDDAIDRVLPYVQRMRFGFSTPGRPVGVFLFCGKSGTGKTELAKELAQAVYGSEENLVFFEMGQFNTSESMNIFVGAPPGYVGYGEGKLTNALRDKPRAVLLFDEFDKANPKVHDALLRLLDEGKVDDPAGPVRDGTECIAILTSNVGAERLDEVWDSVKENPNWRTVIRRFLREEFLKRQCRVELLNRVDEVVLFRALDDASYAEIVRRLLARDLDRLRRERQIDVQPDDSVALSIGAYCKHIEEGARAAQRLTQSVVITPMIDFVLRNRCEPPVRLVVRAEVPGNDPDAEPIGVVSFAPPGTGQAATAS